ncbi:hypothetical protein LTR37_009864 [Vermiconidia calcicola]|uniref:Uncharacterized protein n=1 Tax=Vermiconidia calcicola TaxID=1690605 RepID=A0ACC3N772_9PEZI|nr:hypothetical protein LTR37_009864 [Vermiconidia calcicola]
MSKADNSGTTVILVAGAFHTGFHTAPAARSIEQAGYNVVSCAPFTELTIASMANAADMIESAINDELQKGQQICLVLHSMAARPGCEALIRIISKNGTARESIKSLVMVAAFLTTNPADLPSLMNGDIETDPAKGVSTVKDPAYLFYNDMEPAATQPFVDAIQPLVHYAPLELSSELYKTIPGAYLFCEKDNIVPPSLQTIEADASGLSVVRLDTGHCPFVSQPELFVQTIDNVIAGSRG